MQQQFLNAESRKELGKNACYRLRKKGYIPAVLYSHGKSESLKILRNDFFKIFKGHISENVLLNLIIDNQTNQPCKVFVKDYQVHPVTDEILHLDFYKVTEGEKIHTRVPVEIVGVAKGVKMGGILEFVERELEIECLPSEIPEKIVVDVTNLEIGHSIHIKEIPKVGSVKFLDDENKVVVTVLAPHKHEEVKPVEGVKEESQIAGESGKGEQ